MARRRSAALILALLVASLPVLAVGADAGYVPGTGSSDPGGGLLLSAGSADSLVSYRDYLDFLAENTAIPPAEADLPIPFDRLEQGGGVFETLPDAVRIDEDGSLTVEVTAPRTALYELRLTYMPEPGRSAACELSVLVGDAVPYRQAATILADRIWKPRSGTIEQDSNGNDIRPTEVEDARYSTLRAMDSTGYTTTPLLFRLEGGVNRITIHDNRESIRIREIALCAPEALPSYEEYIAEHADASMASESCARIQAEHPAWTNDPVLVPTSDRTSPLTEPYKGSKISLNTIGQDGWSLTGQTIAWSFDAPQDGLYEIRFKAKQNYTRGTYSSRTLLVDGRIPFAEAQSVRFTYSSRWQRVTLGDGTDPYFVYLGAGRHELALRVTLGDLGDVLGRVDACAAEVGSIYRKFLMIMGANPDTMRDYKLDRQLPDVFVEMADLADRLDAVAADMGAITGTRGTELLSLTRMAMTLRDFVEKPYEIPAKFAIFTGDMSSLNAWKNDAAYRPLELDSIDVAAPDAPEERVRPSIWETIAHGATLFFSSFFENYDDLGRTSDTAKTLTVWSTTGRDQAQVLNQLVKSGFRPDRDVNVQIQLVRIDAILPSTVAGNGPDVILYAPQQMPVNFAIRGAALDLSRFPGFDDVAAQFRESALTPARFNGGVYGLPETETFPMLFYRADILREIGVSVPRTWPEVLQAIPDLQKSNMSLLLETGISNTVDNTLGLSAYAMLLYQNGGRFYEGDGIRTLLDQETAIETFRTWCRLYTNYGLPTTFNAAYRFRTGESPLVISDMSLYNTLMISAPEIKGLWGMTTVPGTPRNGTVDRSVKTATTYTMATRTCDDPDDAWTFIRWWLGEDTQLAYARDLESLMGTAARYMTANVDAFSRLPWATKDLDSILEQSRWTVGVPEVAGGYFLPRHINNAFRSVVIDKADPREALISYAKVIDEELREKRLEFGLPVDGG